MSKRKEPQTQKSNDGNAEHYVYLYRDKKGKVKYVGYGRGSSRAVSHANTSHNSRLKTFLDKKSYTLEIAGPFDSKPIGTALETALISALKPEFNVAQGSTRYRFRPLGVPQRFAARLDLPALTRSDLLKPSGQKSRAPVLLVYISDKKFDDGRIGYNLANPPGDKEILKRMKEWWLIGRFVSRWIEKPSSSPRLLLGVSGSPGSQIIIGSVEIDAPRWHETQEFGGRYSIPVKQTRNLDACSLRGRRIAPEAMFRFGAITTQFVIYLTTDELAEGGQPQTRAFKPD